MNPYVLIQIFTGLNLFLTILNYIVLAYCVMSWFVRPTNSIFLLLSRFVQPLIAPFRSIGIFFMRRGARFDVSFLALFVAIYLVRRVLAWLLPVLLGSMF